MSYPISDRIADLELLAPEYYRDDLPYHNYGHVLDTVATFDSLCEVLAENDVTLDRSVGRAALLMHDAHFRDDYRAKGFDAHESYAGYLARNVLAFLDVKLSDAIEVEKCIAATRVSETPQTNLQKAVRYADLGNVYGRSYHDFVRNFLLLQKEAVILRRPIADTFETQRELSMDYLGRYLTPLTFETDDGRTIELPQELNFAERNIARLGRATVDVLQDIPGMSHLIPSKWQR